MVPEVVDLLLETLRLRRDVDVTGLGRRWATLDPAGLAALAEYEGCVIWLYQRLKELQILDLVPGTLAQCLSARAYRLAARNLLVDAQRDELVQILNELRVPHVLLKGAARRLLAGVCPYVSARKTTDVDVLVPQDVAHPTWVRLQAAGFVATDRERTYDGHFHLPPLKNGKGVAVELHTSTSNSVPPAVAWGRIDGSARAVSCKGGPTRVPAATELLWSAITHAPLPHPEAFRMRFFQDVAVGWGAGSEVDWAEIATRLASAELRDGALARRWLGTALQLSGIPDSPLGALPAPDLSQVLSWRLTVFRRLGAGPHPAAPSVWGPHPVSRTRRLLVDEGTRAEFDLPLIPPRGATTLGRAGRRAVAGVARLFYDAWRRFRRA